MVLIIADMKILIGIREMIVVIHMMTIAARRMTGTVTSLMFETNDRAMIHQTPPVRHEPVLKSGLASKIADTLR